MLRRSIILAAMILGSAPPSWSQTPLTDGALLVYGNYCGPGNRGYDKPPVDALDAACRHHDRCTPGGGVLPTCACNARLRREAARVAADRRQPANVRDMAVIIANAAQIPLCRP